MTADRVHASVGALQALSRSLATYRTGFDESARAVERSLAASSDEADEAVARRRRDLDDAVDLHRRAEARRREAEAELSAARAELASAQNQDPRYRGSAVSRAQGRVSRASGELDTASAIEREAEAEEHRCRRLKERSEAARSRIRSALNDYRSSVSAARAAETAIALAAMTKVVILKDVLGTYLSSSGSPPRSNLTVRSTASLGDHDGAATDSLPPAASSGGEAGETAIDWKRLLVDPAIESVQLLAFDPAAVPAFADIGAMDHAEEQSAAVLTAVAHRWSTGGAAMFRRNPHPDYFDARDARDGLSGPNSFRAMVDFILANPVVLDPVTGALVSGAPLLRALIAIAAETIPIRFAGDAEDAGDADDD